MKTCYISYGQLGLSKALMSILFTLLMLSVTSRVADIVARKIQANGFHSP